MPYPNEHAFRLRNPDKYPKKRRQNNKFGSGIHAIWGITRSGKVELQAIRFSKSQWSFTKAKAWIARHGYKPMERERAVANTVGDNLEEMVMPEEGTQFTEEIFQTVSANMSAMIEERELDGKKMLAVPTIMITKGVVNGLLYTDEALSEFPAAWNGRPIVVRHPTGPDGQFASANKPEVIAKQGVGNVYDTRYDAGKLKCVSYIDPVKADKVDRSVMASLRANKPLEVSTGLFLQVERKNGTFQGKEYSGVVHGIRAEDHLAVLPGQRGACSWEDGAGMPRVNQDLDGNARGDGQGVGGPKQGDGGTDTCVCPDCGATAKHERGTPCNQIKCPECGTPMTGMASNAVTKKEGDGNHPAGHYLVVEDPQKPSTWHLRVKDVDGKIDHRLMGAAWAALHGGYRGSKYVGPDKAEALRKLKALYKREDMKTPAGNEGGDVSIIGGALEGLLDLGSRILFGKNASFGDISRQLHQAVKEQGIVAHVVDVFKDSFVYEVANDEGEPELFQQGYQVKEDGVELSGKPKPVSVEVSYVPTGNDGSGSVSHNTKPHNKEIQMNREERIAALIKDGKVKEEDKEHLAALNDATFDSLFPRETKSEEEEGKQKEGEGQKQTPTPAANKPKETKGKEAEGKKEGEGIVTVEEYVQNAPAEVREGLTRMVENDKKQKAEMVKAILASKRNSFSEDELNGMAINQLEKLVELAAPEANYAGRANGKPKPAMNEPKIEALPLPGYGPAKNENK